VEETAMLLLLLGCLMMELVLGLGVAWELELEPGMRTELAVPTGLTPSGVLVAGTPVLELCLLSVLLLVLNGHGWW
jgi:hypothetical protein